MLGNVGKMFADFVRDEGNFGRCVPEIGPKTNWSNSRQCWAMLGKCWPDLVESRAGLVGAGPKSAQRRPNSNQTSVDIGRDLARRLPVASRFRPNVANVRPHFGRCRRELVRFGRKHQPAYHKVVHCPRSSTRVCDDILRCTQPFRICVTFCRLSFGLMPI